MPIRQHQAQIKQDAHSFQTYNFSTILQNPIFVIDSHFEEYYTHHIEVTPICDYFMEIPRFVD